MKAVSITLLWYFSVIEKPCRIKNLQGLFVFTLKGLIDQVLCFKKYNAMLYRMFSDLQVQQRNARRFHLPAAIAPDISR
jgi:hypothetical protein